MIPKTDLKDSIVNYEINKIKSNKKLEKL